MEVVMELKAEMDVETEMEMEVGMKTEIEMEMEMQGRCVLPKTVKGEGPVQRMALFSLPWDLDEFSAVQMAKFHWAGGDMGERIVKEAQNPC